MDFFDFFDFSGLSQNLAEALGFYAEGMLQSQGSGRFPLFLLFCFSPHLLVSGFRTSSTPAQRSLVCFSHLLGKDYSALVLAIETKWREETTNLSDTILRVIRHAEINKGNAQDVVENTKVLATATHRAPKGTCTTPECIERGVTTHYSDRCWIKDPGLRAKYSLRQMKPRRSNRNFHKAASASITQGPKREASPPPELES